jgi:MscS family membrane protein
MRTWAGWAVGAIAAVLLTAPPARGQVAPPASTPAPQPAPEKDPLGRDTPRGTVVGFMAAARKGNLEAAASYLSADPRDRDLTTLAHRLYVVLDSRLPARLVELSDRPEGSLANPLNPELDVVGTINTSAGPLDLVVERVTDPASGRVWLFSPRTLDAIPAVYDEIHRVAAESYLPGVLTRPRIGGIRLFGWIAFFVVLPLLYRGIGLFGMLIGPPVDAWRRRHGMPGLTSRLLPGSIRLLLLAAAIRWMLARLDLPFFERQVWFATARVLATSGLVWLMLLANAFGERYLHARLRASNAGDISAPLRLARRVGDVLVVAAGGLIVLAYFGIDPTAALAGLGIGGIAVALSAQKTLENVIGGVSIVFDKAVRVGDVVKVGGTSGTVDYIGLRSTRIRTNDRTILSVPNGQIATVNIETLSTRDKFWFHHFVGLRYETTASQMRAIVADFTALLRGDRRVDPTTPRARFLRLGPFSIDVEVSAYLYARDWEHFLEIQEGLLLEMMEIVERRGATIALPTQTVHVAAGPSSVAHPQAPAGLP